jgi:uncharacterized phage protein gp47/JayE
VATYDILTLDEMTEFAVAAHRNLLPNKRVDRFSDNYKRTRHLALVVSDLHGAVLGAWRAALIPTSKGPELAGHADVWGTPAKGATGSSGENVGRLRGTVGAAFTAGLVATHVSGQAFELGEGGNIPAAGYIDVDIIATSTGRATNLQAGEVLALSAPPAGIQATIELQAALEGGEDVEPDGELLRRVLARTAHPATGGSAADWVAWATAVAPVVEAYAYRHRKGFGTVDIAAFRKGSGSARALTVGERATLLAALQPRAPGHAGMVRVLETEADPQPIKLVITPGSDPALQRDWNDTTPPVVSSYAGGTRTLTFTAARPADMRAGDRLCWDNAGGELSVIESLSGANAVVLKVDPSVAPAGNVYSGGPITELVQRAIKNLVDGWTEGDADPDPGAYHAGVGPTLGDFGAGWDGGLRPAAIQGAVMERVDGLIDVVVSSPAANYSPTDYGYPDDAKTRYVTASYVFVRYA